MSTDSIEFAKLDVMQRIDAIEKGLLLQDPMLPQHLAAIHRTLLESEELVHLLSDEQVRTLIAGQRKHVQVQLVKEITTKKSTKVPKATAEDF